MEAAVAGLSLEVLRTALPSAKEVWTTACSADSITHTQHFSHAATLLPRAVFCAYFGGVFALHELLIRQCGLLRDLEATNVVCHLHRPRSYTTPRCFCSPSRTRHGVAACRRSGH